MLDKPTPLLAHHLAALTAELRAQADRAAAEAGLIAALHALILATLARLFTRLETLVDLWAAGQLPHLTQAVRPRATPAPAHPSPPRQAAIAAPRPHRAAPQATPSIMALSIMAPPISIPARAPPHHPHPALGVPHATIPRPARLGNRPHAPPFLQNPLRALKRRTTILLRIRNKMHKPHAHAKSRGLLHRSGGKRPGRRVQTKLRIFFF